MSWRAKVSKNGVLSRRQAMADVAAVLITAPFVIRSSSAQPAAINIGVVVPLSGANAQFGVSSRNGIELVADEINAAGGIKALSGAKINLVVSDSTFEPNHSVDHRPPPDHSERGHRDPRRVRIVVDARDFRGDGASRHSVPYHGVR